MTHKIMTHKIGVSMKRKEEEEEEEEEVENNKKKKDKCLFDK